MNTLTPFRRPTQFPTLQSEVNRMFDSLFAETDWPLGFQKAVEQVNQQAWSPKVDIAEDANAFHIHAELPGLKRDEIKVNIENNLLTIEGERTRTDEKKEEANGRTFHRVERSWGKFYRAFRLPQSVDQAKIEAKFANGVLELSLPKAEAVKPKQIEVKIQDSAALPSTPAVEISAAQA
jgi:HSP20 family protein